MRCVADQLPPKSNVFDAVEKINPKTLCLSWEGAMGPLNWQKIV